MSHFCLGPKENPVVASVAVASHGERESKPAKWQAAETECGLSMNLSMNHQLVSPAFQSATVPVKKPALRRSGSRPRCARLESWELPLIQGILNGCDRMLFRGPVRFLAFLEGMAGFLKRRAPGLVRKVGGLPRYLLTAKGATLCTAARRLNQAQIQDVVYFAA